ncbi:MAG: hypothetical protein IPK82_15940 [Polyangiaceae bacterium]|nr:hypothetical protein [Polyangiaceae bacterium]
MRPSFRSLLTPLGFAAAAFMVADSANAAGDVGVLVLKEHGVGSAAQAQPYVDKLVALAAKHSGWSGAKGSYQTTRTGAEKFITDSKPNYGILSLAAFLGLKDKHKLDVIGSVSSSRAGGQQYHLVSKNAADAAGCKGKALASDHADDQKFIDNVVFAGKMKLADFTLTATTRPIQTIKKVVADEAECALIDDAQFAELANVEGASAIKSVWKSDKLPPMVIVAFPTASADERKGFQGAFGKVCEGDGKDVCKEVGISAMKTASVADYQTVITAYAKK